MPAKSIVTRLKHVTNARRALENARFRYHTSLELWKQYDFRARCCSASKPGSESIRRVSVGLHPKIKPETFLVGSEAYKLEVKASHMLLRGLHPT